MASINSVVKRKQFIWLGIVLATVGVVGGGGIGDLAIRYGYYRFETDVMLLTVVSRTRLDQVPPAASEALELVKVSPLLENHTVTTTLEM